MEYDGVTVGRLRDLEGERRGAVERGEFERAIRIRELTKRVKEMGREVKGLEERKREAMKGCDYTRAQKIKEKVEEIKRQIGGSRMSLEGTKSGSALGMLE